MKRVFDIVCSFLGLLALLPLFILISILIIIDSKGGIFFRQVRVGKNNKDFKILKFRTMRPNSDKSGLLTIGSKDNRVTKIGYFLRKYKLDELPQLINVFVGDMSFVGPRPEVRKYVDMYDQKQLKVLSLRPGITDYASIEYSNENELLSKSDNPEQTYINEIMPAKLSLNLKYIKEKGIKTDIRLIFKTIAKIFK
ncbi:MAG: sugar transferase [Bacteroidales bacterium]|nr:sugar transferase [Bacteroidales bacterium]MDD4217960.1 sugar transferase [Bacteroidales bacterium]MDY0140625.1 sugar transferase [Bacteroidales bacterium]